MTNQSRKTLLVMLDAAKGDYIKEGRMPKLEKLSREGVYFEYLKPEFGFCERTEMLVGKSNKETNLFTAFGFSPENSPYKKYSTLLKVLNLIEKTAPFEFKTRIVRKIIWTLLKTKPGTYHPVRIPINALTKFALTEDGYRNYIKYDEKSIYKKTKNPFLITTTSMDEAMFGDDDARLNCIEKNINSEHDFYSLYISALDSKGHIYGPESEEMDDILKKTDAKINELVEKLKKINDDVRIIICGDHGMVSVKKEVDIEEIIKKHSHENDLDYFLDSTMARFWIKNNRAWQRIRSEIEQRYGEHGTFVSQSEYNTYGIPELIEYGEYIWICKEGVLICPDFFNRKKGKIKGMHGYVPENSAHFGFMLVIDEKLTPKRKEGIYPLSKVYEVLNESIT